MPDDAAHHPVAHRLNEFYRRLGLLPRAKSAERALKQICQTLDEVEDELSGVVKKATPPPLGTSDGRMYCPVEDHIIRGSDGSILAITRGHRVEIGSDGSVRIINKATSQVEFEK
jgi:hypothetical protein